MALESIVGFARAMGRVGRDCGGASVVGHSGMATVDASKGGDVGCRVVGGVWRREKPASNGVVLVSCLINLKTAVGVGIRQPLRWSQRLGPCCRPRALTRRQGCRTPSISGAEWQRHPAAGPCCASGWKPLPRSLGRWIRASAGKPRMTQMTRIAPNWEVSSMVNAPRVHDVLESV